MDTEQIDYQKLAMQLLAQNGGATHKAVSSTPTGVYGHGMIGNIPGGTSGLFSFPGLEPDIINAMVMPKMGLLDLLPSRTTVYDEPLVGIMTGVTATTGSEPSGVCDDPPVAGLMKLCTHKYLMGRMSRMSRVFDLDRAGRFVNRSDFNDLTLIGNPLAAGANGMVPQLPGNGAPALAVRSEIAKALFELGVSFGRDFADVIYNGTPSANTANGGYKEPYGLDILINTGYRDAYTAVACPAADSIVNSFGNLAVETNGTAIVSRITAIYRNLKFNASRMGLTPATWVLAMPWALFYQLTDVWPCAYLSYRCTNLSTGTTQFVDSTAQIAMRDDMRGDVFTGTGQYLLIDGQRVPVVLDDAIAETVVAGASFRSTIYFVPLRILGNRPATYIEYINYDGPMGAMEMANTIAPQGSYFTTNNGRYLWHRKPPTNFCVQMLAKTEWRVILETPQIAARLTGVQYTPVMKERSGDPANTSYFVDGGGTTQQGPSYYSPTA